jgi:hypothetical protein
VGGAGRGGGPRGPGGAAPPPPADPERLSPESRLRPLASRLQPMSEDSPSLLSEASLQTPAYE